MRLGDLDGRTLDTTARVVAVRRSDNRPGAARGVAVYNLVGGRAWRETGRPLIRDDGTADTAF